MLLHAGDIYVLVLLHLLLTVSGPVVVGMCSSMDILWLIILLASGWFLGMLTVIVNVTHLNCLHIWFITHCFFEDCRLFSDYNWCCTVCRACVNVTDYSCQVFLGFCFMCAVISSGGQVLPV